MKKIVIGLMLVCLLLVSCGSNKVINGKEIETFGLIGSALNDPSIATIKEPGIKYQVIWGNVIWGVILFETIVAPIYFYGFSMFEPVGVIK